MKILCVSDQIDPLVYSVLAKERFSDIDLILCAGDLPMDYVDFIVSTLNKPAYFIFGNHNLSEFSFYHKIADNSAHPVRKPEYAATDLSHSHGATYCGFRVLSDKELSVTDGSGRKTPLLIAGISGSMRYNRGLNQYTEKQMFARILAMIPHLVMNKLLYGRYLDILLTHAAPRHVHDKEDPCHIGFECFNWFMRAFRPKYLVHGHIHLYDSREERRTPCGETTVVNAYSHCVIDFEEGS